MRVRLREPMTSREIAARVENDTGYKSVSWQEANEDLISTFIIRNIIMYTVVERYPAGRQLRHLQHHLHHHA